MCLFFIILLFGPRLGVMVWWLVDQARFNLIFDTWILPLLGFIFAPWTTLMYVLVGVGGVEGFDWLWLGLGFLADMVSYVSSAAGNKDKIPGMAPAAPTSTPDAV